MTQPVTDIPVRADADPDLKTLVRLLNQRLRVLEQRVRALEQANAAG